MATFDSRDRLGDLPAQGCSIRFPVLGARLDFGLAISDAATWRIPELDVEQASFAHRGFQGSVRGFMERVRREVQEARDRYPASTHARFNAFLERIDLVLAGGAGECQLEVRDPSGLSSADSGLGPQVAAFERSVREEKGLGVQYPEPYPQLNTSLDVARKVHGASRIVAFSGAGISVESGITPFRAPRDGEEGSIWGEFDAQRMTVTGFNEEPEVATDWWVLKRKLLAETSAAAPNPAHEFFGMLEDQGKLRGVITQNIDSLHQRAGVPEAKVIELHGHMRRLVCSNYRLPLNPIPFRDGTCNFTCGLDEHDEGSGVPSCPRCGCPLRTETVMFGQPMPDGAMESSRELVAGADLLFVIGSTLLVQPANELPAEALRRGIPVVMVNLDDTSYDANAASLVRNPAGEFLREVARLLAEGLPEAPSGSPVPEATAAPADPETTTEPPAPACCGEDSDDEQLFGDDDIGAG